MSASLQLLTYSSSTVILPSHMTLYNLFSWNSVVKRPRNQSSPRRHVAFKWWALLLWDVRSSNAGL